MLMLHLTLQEQEKGSKKLKASDEELLLAFHGNMTKHLKFAIESNRRLYNFATQEVTNGKTYIINEIKRLDYTSYEFLQSIPGIDRWGAAIIIVEIGGTKSFFGCLQKRR